MKSFRNLISRGIDWSLAGAIGVLALAIYMSGLADYAMPGESARLLCSWYGLEEADGGHFPIVGWFFKTLRIGQALAPLCGCICAIVIYHLMTFFVRENVGGDFSEKEALVISRIAGTASALVFVFTPSVRNASTYLNPMIFDTAWALLALSLLFPFMRVRKEIGWIFPILMAVMLGFGTADTFVFCILFPFYLLAIWIASMKRAGKSYCVLSIALFTTFYLAFVIGLIVWSYHGGSDYMTTQKAIGRMLMNRGGNFLIIPTFSTLPFFICLFACPKAFRVDHGWMQLSFHGMMTLVSMLALVTPISASSILKNEVFPSVLVPVYTACTAGYLMAFWWACTRMKGVNESVGKDKLQRNLVPLSWSAGGSYLLILAVMLTLDFFLGFKPRRGEFADRIADRIVEDMGDRTWFISSGTTPASSMLDDHILLAANRAGKDVRVLNMNKLMSSQRYAARIADRLEDDGLGEYARTLREFGAARFLKHWFKNDAEIAKKAVVFDDASPWKDAPGCEAIPELFFFGGDAGRLLLGDEVVEKDMADRRSFNTLLTDEYAGKELRDVEGARNIFFMRDLRRHLGCLTSWRAYREMLYGARLRNNRDPESAAESARSFIRSFDYYEMILSDIDPKNISAICSEGWFCRIGVKKALDNKARVQKGIDSVNEQIKALSPGRLPIQLRQWEFAYGKIVDRDTIVRMSLANANAGLSTMAVNDLREIIDLLGPEDRLLSEFRYIAPILATGSDDERRESLSIQMEMYNRLKDKAELTETERFQMRRALIGLAQLSLQAGDRDGAIRYLEQAKIGAGKDAESSAGVALLHLIRGELKESLVVLDEATCKSDDERLMILGLKATILIHSIDKARLARDEDLLALQTDELHNKVFTEMRAIRPKDFRLLYYQAVAKCRVPTKDNLKAAKEDLLEAAQVKPASMGASQRILEIDIVLNNRDEAIDRAERILEIDKNDPLANWVLGSSALTARNLEAAVRHLSISAHSPRPLIVMLNDYAEALRLTKEYAEAEIWAKKAIARFPTVGMPYDTLATVLLDAGDEKRLAEAESLARKACELTKRRDGSVADIRLLITLARVQRLVGKQDEAEKNLLLVKQRRSELSAADLEFFSGVLKGAR